MTKPAAAPAVTETAVPAVTETAVPAVTETAVPAVTETAAPAVTETMFGAFAQDLIALGAKPSQLQLEGVLTGKTLQDVIALDNAGVRLSGSAERALAARINMTLTEECEDAAKHWSKCNHKDTDALAKSLRPLKAICFAGWKNHSNPSTKWARVRDYGFELANPVVTGDVIAEGAEGADGEGAAAGTTSRTRDLYQRCVVEASKLYRALNSAENDAAIKGHVKRDELTAFLLHMTAGLGALGAPLEDEDLVAFVKTLS